MKDKLVGPRIFLRKLRVSDIGRKYLKWLNDGEINKYLESKLQVWTLVKLKMYVTKANKDSSCILWGIFLLDGNTHVGNIKLGSIDLANRSADIGILIGEKNEWGKGYGAEAIALVVDFAFQKLKLKKLIAGIYTDNYGSIKAFQRCGFESLRIEKNYSQFQRKTFDRVVMGLTEYDKKTTKLSRSPQ